MSDDARSRGTAWTKFAIVAAAMSGNFYVYDSIGPLVVLLPIYCSDSAASAIPRNASCYKSH